MSERGERTNRVRAVVRNDLRILRGDPAFVIIFTVMPLIFMAFTKGASAAALAIEYPGRGLNGAEHVVPGATVLFSGFLVGNIGFGIFREHGWRTWERLRASQISTGELLLAKSVVPLGVLAFQLVVLLGGGALLFDLHIRGSIAAFGLIAGALALMELTLGFMLLSLCRSVIQLNAITSAGAMALGGLGGALTPIELMPSWAQTIAPATPAYWAMRGFLSVLIDGGGVPDAIGPVAVLLGASVLFATVTALRYRVEDAKVSWA